MPINKQAFRIASLTMAGFISAYLSLRLLGGFLVFGGSSKHTFLEYWLGFCLFVIPVLSFPMALVAWWKIRFAVCCWAVAMLLFFGTQIYLAEGDLRFVAKNGTHFLTFLAGGVLLILSMILGNKRPARPRNIP
ncbi:MAG TPA: hypothetical protein VGK36_10340 [Candidatus Angelobacter sp.]